MSGIFDQIINYSPPLIVSGTVNYDGTWNASTNNPTLNNPPAASTKGDYYVVSVAGTQFGITFAVGDWIISNGTAWEKVDLTDAVSSVFGRTGAVVGVSTDYSAVGLTNTAIGAANPASGAFTSLSSSSTTTLNGTTVPASKTLVVTTDKLSALAATTSAELAGVISNETGSGALVFATSPTLVTPILGTPQSGTLTSCTGLPISTGVSGLGTGIATALAVNTGSAGAPVLFNGALGTPTSGTVTNLTGTASINTNGAHNGTVGATTPSTGAFTTLSTNSSNGVTTLESPGISSVGLQFRTNSSNRFKIETPSASADLAFYSAGTTEVARFSSTGIAVTGALSATTGTFSSSVSVANGFAYYFGGQASDTYISGSAALNLIRVTAGATDVADFTTTGLAVTGAVSATGNLILSATNSNILGGTTTGSSSIFNSTGASGITVYGPTHATKANQIDVFAGGLGHNFSSTGLAVTGDASATAQVVSGAVGATGSAWFRAGSTLAVKSGIDISDSSDTSSAVFAAWRNGSGSVIGSISRVTTTNAVAYNTTSDGRLKENLRDFTDSGRLIDSLKPRVFDWKNSDENGKNVVGFVAQEQHAADPIFAHIGAVSVGDKDSETITKQWQRSDSALIPILVAELKSVRARLAALESK